MRAGPGAKRLVTDETANAEHGFRSGLIDHRPAVSFSPVVHKAAVSVSVHSFFLVSSAKEFSPITIA